MAYRYTFVEIADMAKEAGQPIDAFIKSVSVAEKHEDARHVAARSTPEEKEMLKEYLSGLNGQLSEDLVMSEVCKAAGVRKNQGTSSFARREIKRLLELTHQSSATPSKKPTKSAATA